MQAFWIFLTVSSVSWKVLFSVAIKTFHNFLILADLTNGTQLSKCSKSVVSLEISTLLLPSCDWRPLCAELTHHYIPRNGSREVTRNPHQWCLRGLPLNKSERLAKFSLTFISTVQIIFNKLSPRKYILEEIYFHESRRIQLFPAKEEFNLLNAILKKKKAKKIF